jgi:hypothetical protein
MLDIGSILFMSALYLLKSKNWCYCSDFLANKNPSNSQKLPNAHVFMATPHHHTLMITALI